VVDITPDLSRKENSIWVVPPRGLEIQQWLDENNRASSPFVILDDEADMAHLKPRLVKCEFNPGLTAKDTEAAIAIIQKFGWTR
jgi:hypothetical protein